MGDFSEIAERLRAAEREIRVAASLAGEYRGHVMAELCARDTHRRAIKTMCRVAEMAHRLEQREATRKARRLVATPTTRGRDE